MHDVLESLDKIQLAPGMMGEFFCFMYVGLFEFESQWGSPMNHCDVLNMGPHELHYGTHITIIASGARKTLTRKPQFSDEINNRCYST